MQENAETQAAVAPPSFETPVQTSEPEVIKQEQPIVGQ